MNNTAQDGAGIFNQGLRANSKISDSVFEGNIADSEGSRGAGMYNGHDSSPEVSNCIFRHNSVTKGWSGGGGMFNRVRSSPTILNCEFIGNSAYEGGGLLNYHDSNPVVKDCAFDKNSAGDIGGGVCNYGGCSTTITNCLLTANSAREGGGIYYYEGCNSTLRNCTFAENSAEYGASFVCDSYLQDYPSNVQISNSILWDGPNEILNHDASTITITYSDISGGWDGCPGIGCTIPSIIATDPEFVRGPLGGYYLRQLAAGQLMDSPCVDVGSTSAGELGMDLYTTRTDIVTDSGIVDMGYHYPSECSRADFDCDFNVDFNDFSMFALAWLTEPGDTRWDPSFDISIPSNSLIGAEDLCVLAGHWLEGATP